MLDVRLEMLDVRLEMLDVRFLDERFKKTILNKMLQTVTIIN